MTNKYYKKYWILIFIVSFTNIYSQHELNNIVVVDTFVVNSTNHYDISAISIIPFTEKIRLGRRILDNSDYTINYKEAYFSLNDSLMYSLLDTIFISYKSVLLSLKKNYQKRSLIVKYNKILKDSVRVLQSNLTILSSESIFGTGIQKSGTISRGFTVGTNRDLNVTSGLRLELSGRLSDEIEIIAALTDENSPIQPEGNTERLQELDKVFLQIKHKRATGTFGDYDLNDRVGEFGNINRRLQGLKADFNFKNTEAMIAIASSEGTFNTSQFLGQDGNQGPYRLFGKNNERNIIVVAGTEKVYIDGQLMIRGENKDYVIEYGNAEITFTSNRLITSASRITVDYEYSDRQYQRNFIGSNFRSNLINKKLKISFGLFQEGDDQNNPIDLILNDDERSILSNAGDNRNKAVKSGATLGAADSNGIRRGAYTKIDTVIEGKNFLIYRYSPGKAGSMYNVVFSFVGAGLGDYVRISTGKYIFVGKGQGNYMPVKFLPLPEIKRTANIVIDALPFNNFILRAEIAGSNWDKNRFSEIGNNDNNGFARSISLKIKPKRVSVLGLNLNKIGVSFKDRFIDNHFTTLDRVNSIEFNRDYNTDSTANGNELLREIDFVLSPINEINISGKYGLYKKGVFFSSDRYLANVNYHSSNLYNVNYNIDYVKSKAGIIENRWMKQLGSAFYTIGKFKPGVNYELDKKESIASKSDSLSENSHKYIEFAPYIEISKLNGFTLRAVYSLRNEYFPLKGFFMKESSAETRQFDLEFRGSNKFSTTLNLSLRNKIFDGNFNNSITPENKSILIRSQSRFNLINKFAQGTLFYEAATEKSSKLERIFVKVPVGQGNYIYLGDNNNNGITDEEEYSLTNVNGDFITATLPTDELFPIINLRLNTRWRLHFDKIFRGRSLLNRMMRVVSGETVFRVDEKSNTPDTEDIYLLNFSKFLKDSTTINGSNQFQQDIYLFQNNREYSFRIRFNERKRLTHFSTGLENSYFRERSLRIKTRLMKEINNQTDLISTNENVLSPGVVSSSRLVKKNEFISDFSYRPAKNIEVGFKLTASEIKDNFPKIPTIINLNGESIRITWSLAGKGRIRLEGERTELTGVSEKVNIPFQITDGLSLGKNYIIRMNIDYRFANNVQATMNYEGRKIGGTGFIHIMRAEARAYF